MDTIRAALIGAVPLMCGGCGRGLKDKPFALTFGLIPALPLLIRLEGAKHEN